MKKKWFRIIALALTALLVTPLLADKHEGSILDKVKKRGKLVCGVNGGLPGFGFLAEDGKWSGFDTDFGRAIASAVLGDADKVEFVPAKCCGTFHRTSIG